MRLPSTVLLVVVLLVPLSGCSSILGPASQDAATFAPGVSTERVTNASTLGAANRAVLRNTSYTYTRNYSQRVSADGYEYAVDHDIRVRVAQDGSYLYHHRAVVERGGNASVRVDGVWANESVAVTRSVNLGNESVTYTRYRPPEPYPAASVTRSGVSGSLEDATVTEVWNESGTAYVRVRANGSESRRWQGANRTAVNLTTRHNATATIREDGLVRSLSATLSGERPLPAAANDSVSSAGRPIAQIDDRTQIRYASLGTTDVPRPGWVEDALAATDGLAFGETTPPRNWTRAT